MSIIKELKAKAKGMLLDGIGASEQIDSSGEILDVAGCDISDVENGVATINYEHKDDSPTDTIGRLIYAKKIYSEKDCEDARQEAYWKKTEVPFIYIIGELMDADSHPGAVAAAAIVRHYADRGLPIVARWSIEGSTIDKKGNRLNESIFKRIALTLRPCNKDATSGLLFDPLAPKEKKKDDISDIAMDKFEHPMFKRLGGSIEVECMPMIEKSEDLAKEQETKAKIVALVKEWDGQEELAKFIKMKMPEVSDEYLDKFSDLVDGFDLKVKKFEKLDYVLKNLVKAVQDSTKGVEPKSPALEPVEFQGERVIPGFAKNPKLGGPDLAVLGGTSDHWVAVPKENLKDFQVSDLQKWPFDTLTLDSSPEIVPEEQKIDFSKHGISPELHTPEAKSMVHGMDLNNRVSDLERPGMVRGINTSSAWTKLPNGKLGYAKFDERTGSWDKEFDDPKREFVYPSLARNFFGLGQYVPQVALIKHPADENEKLAVIENVESGGHFYGNEDHNRGTVKRLGDSGELHKLTMMNSILGNVDRHRHNYLMTPDAIKLIDHGHAFRYDEVPFGSSWSRPDYFNHYMAQKNPGVDRWAAFSEGAPETLPPAAEQWLLSLDSKKLNQIMQQHGVPVKYRRHAVHRLDKMKNKVLVSQDKNFKNVLFAPFEGFYKPDTHDEINTKPATQPKEKK